MGLQPVTREPWYEDMAIYNAKFSNHEVDAKDEYNDESVLDVGMQRRRPPEEANWDSSTWRYVPHSLKGIKPVTNEVCLACRLPCRACDQSLSGAPPRSSSSAEAHPLSPSFAPLSRRSPCLYVTHGSLSPAAVGSRRGRLQ